MAGCAEHSHDGSCNHHDDEHDHKAHGHKTHGHKAGEGGATRRDFLFLAAGGLGGIGAASFAWPLVNTLNPAADTLALATTEVDISPIAEGQAITVVWRGKPVFIRHRTAAEIESARAVPVQDLRDPQTDDARIKQSSFDGKALPQWLITVGVCTHLGCVPLGQKTTEPRGDYGGWFCPCHGSHYDTAGRIRKGPAPHNLTVPEYAFLTETRIKIG